MQWPLHFSSTPTPRSLITTQPRGHIPVAPPQPSIGSSALSAVSSYTVSLKPTSSTTTSPPSLSITLMKPPKPSSLLWAATTAPTSKAARLAFSRAYGRVRDGASGLSRPKGQRVRARVLCSSETGMDWVCRLRSSLQ